MIVSFEFTCFGHGMEMSFLIFSDSDGIGDIDGSTDKDDNSGGSEKTGVTKM